LRRKDLLIAVSGCLLGENVRYDGGHKRDDFVLNGLGKYVEFLSFCPENLAFGTPRPSIRIVKKKEEYKVVSNKNDTDLTESLSFASQKEVARLKQQDIGGIIFKARSPSCALGSVKTYLPNGFSEGKTDGVFAKICEETFEFLPMEEEGRLQDAWLRENFVMQLFAYDAAQKFAQEASGISDIVMFHRKNKFLLFAKDEKLYRELGNIAANRENRGFETILKEYIALFLRTIAKKSSIKKNRNVLEHMAGFVKRELTQVEKETLHEQIAEYANKIVPLIVPLGTLGLYAKKYNVAYLLEQTFLHPYPKELALRSSIESAK
jgi:uncharacterized protein YbgA (DUF1722 family)/uncharacterized protein YbbK (DUF523 family)